MKIGILTQPLHNNYGGLLQCYALQTILKRMNHEVWVVCRDYDKYSLLFRVKFCIKQKIKSLLGLKGVKLPNPKKIKYISKYTSHFIGKYIQPKTMILRSNSELKRCCDIENFDAYIIGSDQVWRPEYSPCITNYFLDFLPLENKARRISYAASFGVDEWNFTNEETSICARLIQSFNAVSVREDSAIPLCHKYLQRDDVVQVLDPTLLLDREDYVRLVMEENEMVNDGNLFYYILDNTNEKQEIVDLISSQVKMKPFTKMPKRFASYENLNRNIEECVFPSVTSWIRAFMDAEMVVTDSFHGCVFSIIFNKPFWVIANSLRGMARINSLLTQFGLEDRIIIIDKLPYNFSIPIEWNLITEKREALKTKSLRYLNNALE